MATRYGPNGRFCARTRGFTLIEILVALGVASVAATIAVSFFVTSLSYAETARDYKVAAAFAEGQLHRLVNSPEAFAWPKVEMLKAGQPAQVRLLDENGQPVETLMNPIEPQGAVGLDKRVGMRESSFHSNFSWTPYVNLPKADSPYLEVIVTVSWLQEGRTQSLTLTSTMPRAQLEAKP